MRPREALAGRGVATDPKRAAAICPRGLDSQLLIEIGVRCEPRPVRAYIRAVPRWVCLLDFLCSGMAFHTTPSLASCHFSGPLPFASVVRRQHAGFTGVELCVAITMHNVQCRKAARWWAVHEDHDGVRSDQAWMLCSHHKMMLPSQVSLWNAMWGPNRLTDPP